MDKKNHALLGGGSTGIGLSIALLIATVVFSLAEIYVAQIEAQAKKAAAIAALIGPMTSQDYRAKQLALEIIAFTFPEEKQRLTRVTSMISEDKTFHCYALVESLFADSKQTRNSALFQIRRGWLEFEELIPILLEIAPQNTSRREHRINALQVLNEVRITRKHLRKTGEYLRVIARLPAGPREQELRNKVKRIVQ